METKIKKNKKYFSQIHEDAIIEYNNSTDLKKRNQLYVDFIQPVFSEMVEKIVYKFKFTSLPNIDSLMSECEGHLVTIISKYDPASGYAAFSYFSVITKNWFIHKAKKFSKQSRKETQCEEISKNIEMEYLSIQNEYINNRIKKEFFESLMKEIETWETLSLKPNEQKILQAIKIILQDSESIPIFSKKAIYIYTREITKLNTKQILNNLNKFRQLYKKFKTNWDDNV